MANTILVGAQWGDEGKGKIIDVLTEQADIVVRYQGGNNAGHTVFVGPPKIRAPPHPLGHPAAGQNLRHRQRRGRGPPWPGRGNRGTPKAGRQGGRQPAAQRNRPPGAALPPRAGRPRETAKGKNKIGTTKRGIGPAYGDKAARIGLRMVDLINPRAFRGMLRAQHPRKTTSPQGVGRGAAVLPQVQPTTAPPATISAPLSPTRSCWCTRPCRRGDNILFEGAQGTFLDIDHGTYPFVTSSNTTAGGACTGSGVPPHRIDRVVGVMKAYTTRVGEGPSRPRTPRSPTCCTAWAANSAPPPAGPALRLVRCRGHAARHHGQRHRRSRHHQPRRPGYGGDDPEFALATGRRQPSTTCPATSVSWHVASPFMSSSPAGTPRPGQNLKDLPAKAGPYLKAICRVDRRQAAYCVRRPRPRPNDFRL